jgi:Flp pilus assembly protein TadD
VKGNIQRAFVVLMGGVAIIVFTMAFRVKRAQEPRRIYVTLGELQAVHAEVTLGVELVRDARRFSAGDHIGTGKDGRARARLEDGTSLVLDRDSLFVAGEGGLTLEGGRLFIQGAPLARTDVISGAVTVRVGTASLVVDRTEGVSFYCVTGEVVARAFGKETRIRNGEIARVVGDALVVAPEKAFNDWTGGMAQPWSVAGKPRRSVGELWGRLLDSKDDPGSPLAVRSHEVAVSISGEVSTTETRTTYFNAGTFPVSGDFRMALPRDAIVSGFEVGAPDAIEAAEIRLASDTGGNSEVAQLEWAGEDWVRGKTRRIEPGHTVVVVVRYVEWLSPAGGRMTYRYPMQGDGAAPLIGEFHAHIEAGGVDATAVGVGPSMQVDGDVIEERRADFRPTSDLVVDFLLKPGAFDATRAYVVPEADGSAGSYLLVRSEIAPRKAALAGVTLAILVDTSRSISPSSLETERALVTALLDGLGVEDRVVVFSGDDEVHPVGPEALGPVDEARRTAIRRALADLHPGGATDLGATLEKVADVLPVDVPSATLLYVGDGWPTLGDGNVEAMRARLARRAGGLPRLGAVAVGATSNRFGLTALVRGAGPVFTVDAADSGAGGAADVAVHLLADALKPSRTDVFVDLGPDVERVYPRGARTLRDGDTLTTIGRLRGPLPRSAELHYREGADERIERRALSTVPVVDAWDLRRRWSAARVEELMLRGDGREAVVDTALRTGLLTPWTGWAVNLAPEQSYRASPLWGRVLDAGLDGGLAVFSAGFVTPRPLSGAVLTPTDAPWPGADATGRALAAKQALAASARRTLDEALSSVRQCRESRAALRPEIGGVLRVDLSLGANGQVRNVAVRGPSSFDDDAALDRCVELVIRNLTFVSIVGEGVTVVSYELHLPAARDPRARRCSPTSALPSSMRRGVWFERLHRAESEQNPIGAHGEHAYARAKEACELPSWADRRTFVELLLDEAPSGAARVELGRLLDDAGEADAADLVRREAVRRAESPAELEGIRTMILANEPDVALPFVAVYAKASDDRAKLAVVQHFLQLAPHDSRLRRRELALLEALGRKDEIVAESVVVRQEPFLDVALVADVASALARTGAKDEAHRTFSEIAERAPEVPFARAFLGDRLLDEGEADQATVAYETLVRLLPDDPAASFRLALSNAAAGRFDIAARTLAHVSETGGRTSDPALEELARITSLVLVAEARARHPGPADDERLRRHALETALPDVYGFVLVRAPTWVPDLRVTALRGQGDDASDTLTTTRAPSLGIVGFRLERGEGTLHLKLRRQADLEPSRPATARVEVLVTDGHADQARLVGKDVPLRADGDDTELVWDGTSLH